MPAVVEGCRAAGVRKPPREETAMREPLAVPQALWGFDGRGCSGGAARKRWLAQVVGLMVRHRMVFEVCVHFKR